LDAYRDELRRGRVDSVGLPGIYIDASPTGAGKTYSEVPALKRAPKSLTVLPSHKNCREVVALYVQEGLYAAAYPCLNKDTCENLTAATNALGHGLSASGSVCLSCPSRKGCEYGAQRQAAEESEHAVCTHKRAELSFEVLARGRPYVTIHEDATGLLQPMLEVRDAADLREAAVVAREASKLLLRLDDSERYFLWQMEKAAEVMASHLEHAEVTTSLDLPASAAKPSRLDLLLLSAMESTGIWPPKETVLLAKALAAGEVAQLAVQVDEIFAPRTHRQKHGQKRLRRTVVAFKQTRLPKRATIWFSDATIEVEKIEALIGRPVINATPVGSVDHQHPVVQFAVDVTKGTGPQAVVDLLQTVVHFFPFSRAGVITHAEHLPVIRDEDPARRLPERLRGRVIMTEHFRGGGTRGSNDWHRDCDLLIVLGTPRVPPRAIRTRLIATGGKAAASRSEESAGWGRDYWSAVTITGRRRTVTYRAYRDHDWHAACRAVVAAELRQAIGRGRVICADGIPVVVVTTEPLGLQILDLERALTDEHLAILDLLRHQNSRRASDMRPTGRASDMRPKNRIVGRMSDALAAPLSTADVASHLRRSSRQAQRLLSDLHEARLIEREGVRGGWLPREFVFPSPAAATCPAVAAGLDGRD
jgi:hypothetical protein